ncbi:MAG: KamA family radical SAM protein [Pseudomonadota bacterium]
MPPDMHKLTPPVRRQFEEDAGDDGAAGGKDPLDEGGCMPAPGLIRRYENRALVLATHNCFVKCGFCNRRFFVGGERGRLDVDVDAALGYVAANPEIKEVLVSGGDPLTLGDDELAGILERIRAIDHVRIIRLGTRSPMAEPGRISRPLVDMLLRFMPLVVSVHFNHGDELGERPRAAVRLLVEAGISVLNQSVLLRGVNDDAGVLSDLCWKLAEAGVRPYYLFQCERVKGTSGFWVPLDRGIGIAGNLRRSLPGHAVPHFVVDLPGLDGKAWIDPANPPQRADGGYSLTGSSGSRVFYPDR